MGVIRESDQRGKNHVLLGKRITLLIVNIPAVLQCGKAAAEPSRDTQGVLLGWDHTGARIWGCGESRGGGRDVLWISGEVGSRWVKDLLGINEISEWIWQNIFDRNKGHSRSEPRNLQHSTNVFP